MKIEILGNPIPLKRHRMVGKKAYNSQKHEMENFGCEVRAMLSKPSRSGFNFVLIDSPCSVMMEFYIPIPRYVSHKKKEELDRKSHFKKPDLSNLIKFVEDSLNGIVWTDDSLICSIEAFKVYSFKPKTVIYVTKR